MKAVVFDCDGTLLDMQKGGKPFAGILELLQRLQEQDFHLYVWTARDRLSLEKYLTREGLLRFFDDIRTVSEVPPKPNPQGLTELLAGFSPHNCLVIGDSWTDMQGAKLYGCFALGAVWNNISEAEVLSEFGADEIVNSPYDCYQHIIQLLEG